MARRTKGEGSVSIWKGATSPGQKFRARRTIELPNGTKKVVYGYGRNKTEAIADRKLREQIEINKVPIAETITVAQLMTKWLHSKKVQSLKAKSLHDYALQLRVHIKPVIGDKLVTEVTFEDLQAIQFGLVAEGKMRTAQVVTIRLKTMWKYAMKLYRKQIADGTVKLIDIAEDLDHVKALSKNRRKRIWSTDELKRFMAIARGDYDKGTSLYYPLLFTAASTGLRRGELIGLRWDNVIPTHIYVREQFVIYDGKLHKETPKTEAGHRDIPISAELYEVLVSHRERIERHARFTGNLREDNPLVFPSFNGQPILPRNITRCLDTVCERAEVPRITLHELRKFFTSHITKKLAENGNYSPKIVQHLLGHSTPGVALSVYTKVIQEDLDKATLNLEFEK